MDERIDLELLAGLADALPDWDLEIVGPTLKLDEATLPRAENLYYRGPTPYDRLPDVLAGFDVALMPFALNDATRSISPTKTLEYFAAGLPVVSTAVPDVVADYGDMVAIESDAAGFARACEAALETPARAYAKRVDEILRRQHWDAIARRMEELVDAAAPAGRPKRRTLAGKGKAGELRHRPGLRVETPKAATTPPR